MVKTLEEAYRQISEAFSPSMVKAAQTAAAQRQTSTSARMGGNPTGAPSSVAAPKMNSTQARMGGNPTGAPATAVTRTPAPMGGSAPAAAQRQVGNAQRFRPAPAPAAPPHTNAGFNSSVNAATGGAEPTVDQRRAGMSVTNVRDAMYGSNPTAKAKAGPTTNTGASGQGPVPYVGTPKPTTTSKVATRPDTPSVPKIGSKTGTATQGPNKPAAAPAPTGNPNVRTSGTPAVPGNANIKPSAKLDFKQAYAAARKTGQTNFEWNGKKYNTNMKGETSAKRNQVLARNKQRTAGKAARSGSLMEMIKNICREKAQPLLEYQARSKPTGGYIGAKVPNARMSMHDKMSLPLSGNDVSKRYTLSTVVEAEKEIDDANLEKKKKRSKETLNTEPQQSDEKIF